MTEHTSDFELVIRPKYGLLDLNWELLKEYHKLLFFLAPIREVTQPKDVVKFSGVEKFLDAPVNRYSNLIAPDIKWINKLDNIIKMEN